MVKRSTSQDMSELGKKGAISRWGRKAVADGELRIGDISIDCFVLNDKERVLLSKHLLDAIDLKQGGYTEGGSRERRIVRFVEGKGMSKFVSDELINKLKNPLPFKTLKGRNALAHPATILPELCISIIAAEKSGVLQKQQMKTAQRASALLAGFANIGIIGLVDEATGYQYVRERNALATILEDHIAKEAAAWVKTFPDDFYRELFRLRGINPDNLHKRPKYFGKITNDIVYERLAPSVLKELEKKNPKTVNGYRMHRHFSWLTPDVPGKGVAKLESHIRQVLIIMQESKSWRDFNIKLDKYLPKYPNVELQTLHKES